MPPRCRRLVGMTVGSEMVELVAETEDDHGLRWFAWSQPDLGRGSGSCSEERPLVRLAENEDGGQICKDAVTAAARVAWTRFNEDDNPASGTPITGKDGVTCKYPADPTVALGFLSVAFLIASTVAGYLSLFYPYKEKSVPQGVLFKSTSCMIFFNIAL